MFSDFEALAGKAKDNITELFLLLGDAGTLERSHRIRLTHSTDAISQLTTPLAATKTPTITIPPPSD
ncbi:hypothetical protein [Teredinibacter purpureus]|uniref:hypothetical protein n=1 Tax=Teredinibacter purpureus TaxID=2731756 RepID=UPI0005F81A2D|nr:hypothetical protein [Teredinibacter purpureus]